MEFFQEFKNPGKEFRPVPFWSWNDKLDPDFLRQQIREMDKAGLGGYFMHARGGLETEYLSEEWMKCISACIDEGKKSGMQPWCYDENGWPSGFADGAVTAMGDEYHVRWLEIEYCQNGELPPKDDSVLGIYLYDSVSGSIRPLEVKGCKCGSENGKSIILIRHIPNIYYIDVLNKTTVRAFIEKTHEKYHTGFSKEFGNGLKGFFTDEPQYKRDKIPWSYVIRDTFMKKYGYDIIDNLPGLFIECEGYEKVRYDFWALVSELFVSAYGKQLYDWCQEHNCALTGHVMMEDSVFFQMTATAGAMPFYEYMHIPGVDWLGRRIGSPVTPKQAGSVANQMGKKFVLSESYAMCGWDVNFEELKWIAEWQYVNGVNLMCHHLESYTLRGYRKRDFPPSLFFQQAWWSEFHLFNDYLARLGVILTSGKNVADILLLHPMRSGWILYDGCKNERIQSLDKDFTDICEMLSGIHVDYHYGDESILQRHGGIEDGKLSVGICKYKVVILPPMVTICRNTADLLDDFISQGGKVIGMGEFPKMCDGIFDENLNSLREKIIRSEIDEESFLNLINSMDVPVISISEDGSEIKEIHYQQRDLNDMQIFYMVNHDQGRTFDTTVKIKGKGVLKRLKAEDGSIEDICSEQAGDYVIAETTFYPMQSHIFVLIPDSQDNSAKRKSLIKVDEVSIPLHECWDLYQSDLNAMTLDCCEYRINNGEWLGPVPAIKLMDILLELKRSCHIALKFEFEVNMDLNKNNEFYIVLETPGEYKIFINGSNVGYEDEGWWKDSAFKKLNIKKYVKNGKNEIILERVFYQRQKVYDVLFGENVYETERNKLTYDTELESIYIVGDFAVNSLSGYTEGERKAMFTDGPFIIEDLPRQVKSGDITRQGFCFFSGTMSLKQKIFVNKEEGKKYILNNLKADAVMSKVYVNGNSVRSVLWAPHFEDITEWVTDGENEITIQLFSGNRNLLGPHHNESGESHYVRPMSFTDKPDRFEGNPINNILKENYCFVRFGIHEPTNS